MKKYYLFILFLGVMDFVHAQSAADTLQASHLLQEVEVVSLRSNEDYMLERPGNDMRWITADVGNWLEKTGMAIVNCNGAKGSASTVRFRGLASDHSVFNWNDVPINSISLGTCDLSMLPIFFFDEIRFYSSAGNTSLPVSGPGMSMSLRNDQSFRESSLAFVSSANSLHNTDLALNVKTCGEVLAGSGWIFRSNNKFFYSDIQNDFVFTDNYLPDAPRISQSHNNGRNMGLLEEFHVSKERHAFSASIWLQERNMQLPALMGQLRSGSAEQYDAFTRFMFSHLYNGRRLSIRSSLSRIKDVMRYADEGLGADAIDSRISSNAWMLTSRLDYSVHEYLEIISNNLVSIQEVITSAYAHNGAQLRWASSAAGIHAHKNALHAEADYRMEFREATRGESWTSRLYMILGFGSLRLSPEVRIARRFRNPDMNEMFWMPGGNPNLAPEQGLIRSASLPLNVESKRFQFHIRPEYSWSDMKDWIQWVPVNGFVWSPVNIKKVRSRVFECPLDMKWISGEFTCQAGMRYTYTDARMMQGTSWDASETKQMIYTPRHLLFGQIGLTYRNWSIDFQNRHTDTRFTDESNNPLRALPAYQLSSSSISYHKALDRMDMTCMLNVENLFDVAYESVRSYAMPGRVIGMTLVLRYQMKKYENREE